MRENKVKSTAGTALSAIVLHTLKAIYWQCIHNTDFSSALHFTDTFPMCSDAQSHTSNNIHWQSFALVQVTGYNFLHLPTRTYGKVISKQSK